MMTYDLRADVAQIGEMNPNRRMARTTEAVNLCASIRTDIADAQVPDALAGSLAGSLIFVRDLLEVLGDIYDKIEVATGWNSTRETELVEEARAAGREQGEADGAESYAEEVSGKITAFMFAREQDARYDAILTQVTQRADADYLHDLGARLVAEVSGL